MQTELSVSGQIQPAPDIEFKDRKFKSAVIINPKRYAASNAVDASLFPYYAGYSTQFTDSLLKSLEIEPGQLVLDPWNGSGTTTHSAFYSGFKSIGFDLNPVMVVVAKASLIAAQDRASLLPLAQSLLEQSKARNFTAIENDPLSKWLMPDSVESIRRLEEEINRTLISHEGYTPLLTASHVGALSSLAAFFYVVLFKVTRRLLSEFIPSNPTWTKLPESSRHRKRPSRLVIHQLFFSEAGVLEKFLLRDRPATVDDGADARILVGSAEKMDLERASADVILSSPPYCTRIDYAVATAIELAIVRCDEAQFDSLRRSLMGTSTVPAAYKEEDSQWGKTCLEFLDRVRMHPSKASHSYYLKSHLQYYASLFKAMSEIGRVLKKDGKCVLVVQDSYYKNVYNDVSQITCEMAESVGLEVRRRDDFHAVRSMVRVNSKAREYMRTRKNNESVLCFAQAS